MNKKNSNWCATSASKNLCKMYKMEKVRYNSIKFKNAQNYYRKVVHFWHDIDSNFKQGFGEEAKDLITRCELRHINIDEDIKAFKAEGISKHELIKRLAIHVPNIRIIWSYDF